MRTTILALCLLLAGCDYFQAQPDRVSYEYEETSTNCAKILEYPDRLVILYIDCQKAPDTIRRVRYFGEGVE